MATQALAQTDNAVNVNQFGTAGACVSVGTGASVEILSGITKRYQYCARCSVPVRCTWTDPASTDLGPAVTPTSTVGYPLTSNIDYCEDARTFGKDAVQSRMDCISTNGTGTCCTREEQ